MARISIPKAPRRFTDRYVAALKPVGERYTLTDASGLSVRVGSRGERVFVLAFRQGKATTRLTLGTYVDDAPAGQGITLSEANARLTRAREQIKQGIDPRTGAAPGIAVPGTVGELAEEFYKRRILPKRRRPEGVRDVLDRDIIPVLGARRPRDITTVDCAKLIDGVVDRGAAGHAGKVLAVLKQAFSFGVTRGYLPHNPAAPLRREDLGVVQRVRDRTLADLEIAALWHTLSTREVDRPAGVERRAHASRRMQVKVSPTLRLALKVLLLTGVRSGELRAARWEHVDLSGRVWTIPEHKLSRVDKAPVPLRVPLSGPVVALLRELQELAGTSPWVLPSQRSRVDADGQEHAPAGPMDEKALAHVAARLRGRVLLEDGTAIPDWSAHDLRRTLRSGLARLGIAPHVAETCLGHSLGRIVSVYDRHDYVDERRAALERWAAHVLALVSTGAGRAVA